MGEAGIALVEISLTRSSFSVPTTRKALERSFGEVEGGYAVAQFKGKLLVTDREALLVQVTQGGAVVQTPTLGDTNPPTATSTEQKMDWARGFFVNKGLQTGSAVTIEGTLDHFGSGGIPVILIFVPS